MKHCEMLLYQNSNRVGIIVNMGMKKQNNYFLGDYWYSILVGDETRKGSKV